MRWWLVAALAAAVAVPARAAPVPAAPARGAPVPAAPARGAPVPAAPARAAPARAAPARDASERRDHTRRPDNSSLSVTNELGMVDQLRRELLADNEDYLPSDSEAIPMRARLSGESAGAGAERGAGDAAPAPRDTRFREVAAREARLARYLTPGFRASTHQLEPVPDKEEPGPDPHESLLSQEEIQTKKGKKQYGDELLQEDKIDRETTPALDYRETSHHEEINGRSNERQTEETPKAIPTRNFVSVEKFDVEYEFKANRDFPHRTIGGFDEAQKPKSGETKGDDAVDNDEMEMENRVEEQAHAQVLYDADPPPADFLPRAHDDTATTGGQTEPATTTVIKSTSNANGPTDISISKRDLLYYMDEEKLAKSNLSIGFNADVAIDYKDFAQREPAPAQATPAPVDGDATSASKKYRILKMRGGGRRSGRGGGGRRFIQEEGAGGVAILTVDAGPFPEFRLPRERRQYMSEDASEAEPPAPAPPAPPARSRAREPQRSLDRAPIPSQAWTG